MNDYGFKPSMLFFFALNEEGAENDSDDIYKPDSTCRGSSACGDDGDRVDWNTTSDADLDLRIWF